MRVFLSVSCLAVTLAGCAVEAAPSGLGAGSLKNTPESRITQTRGGAPDIVVAHSRYGHGSVSGAVRMGRRSYEVRLPGGTWIDCARNCSEALRRESIDFWESRGGRNDPVDGPAYLRWSW